MDDRTMFLERDELSHPDLYDLQQSGSQLSIGTASINDRTFGLQYHSIRGL